MKEKNTTKKTAPARKRPSTDSAAETPAAESPHTLAGLAALIKAVLNHPLLPESVYDDLWEAVNQLDTPMSYYTRRATSRGD